MASNYKGRGKGQGNQSRGWGDCSVRKVLPMEAGRFQFRSLAPHKSPSMEQHATIIPALGRSGQRGIPDLTG